MRQVTRQLLEHIRDLPQTAAPPLNWGYVNMWAAAGYPDLDAAPEPDRLAALESGVKALAEQHAALAERVAVRADQLDRVANRVALLTSKIAALEQRPSEPQLVSRFVPTEPGWYWMRLTDGQVAVRWYDASAFSKGLAGWLAPVAPYAPPTRTEPE